MDNDNKDLEKKGDTGNQKDDFEKNIETAIDAETHSTSDGEQPLFDENIKTAIDAETRSGEFAKEAKKDLENGVAVESQVGNFEKNIETAIDAETHNASEDGQQLFDENIKTAIDAETHSGEFAQSETPKKSSSSKFVMFGIVAVVIIGVIFAAVKMFGKSNEQVLLDAYGATLDKVVTDVKKIQAFTPLNEKLLNESSTETKISIARVEQPDLGDMKDIFEGLGIKTKGVNSANDKLAQLGLSLLFNEKNLELGAVQIDDEKMRLSLSDFYDKVITISSKHFGADMNKLMEKSGEKPIYPDDLDYSYSKLTEQQKSMKFDLKLLKDYIEAAKALTKDVVVKKEGDVYSFSIPSDNVRNALIKLIESKQRVFKDLTVAGKMDIDKMIEELKTDKTNFTINVKSILKGKYVEKTEIVLVNDEKSVAKVIVSSPDIDDSKLIINNFHAEIYDETDTKLASIDLGGKFEKEFLECNFSVTVDVNGAEAKLNLNSTFDKSKTKDNVSFKINAVIGGMELVDISSVGNYTETEKSSETVFDNVGFNFNFYSPIKMVLKIENKRNLDSSDRYSFDKPEVEMINLDENAIVEIIDAMKTKFMENLLPAN